MLSTFVSSIVRTICRQVMLRSRSSHQSHRNSGFEAASRLQYNKGDGQFLEADDQVVHPLALSWNTECLA